MIKSDSEAMTREELEHVATLRRERCLAYRRVHSHASCQTGLRPASGAESRVNARIPELREVTLLVAEDSNLRAEFAELDPKPSWILADAHLTEAENAGDEEHIDLLSSSR